MKERPKPKTPWDGAVAENLAILHTEVGALRQLVAALIDAAPDEVVDKARDLLRQRAEMKPMLQDVFRDHDRAWRYQTELIAMWMKHLERDDGA